MQHFTVLLCLGLLLCLLRYAKCEHDTTTTIEVGGSGSNCSSLAHTTNIVHTEWNIYVDWGGDYFTSPCEFKFYAKESDDNDDNEENYKVCVKRITYDVSDCNVWLVYEKYGEKSSNETYTCSSTVEENYCADEGKDYINITFSNSYSISSILPSSFQNSAIRLQVYAKYEFPGWLISVIAAVGSVFLLAVFIIIICCYKRHKKRSQDKVLPQNSQNTPGGTQQTINQRPGSDNTTTMSQTSHHENMNTAGFANSTHQYNTQYNTQYSNTNATGFGNPTMPMPIQNRSLYPVRLEPIQNAKQYNYTDKQLYGHQQNHPPPPPPPVFNATGTSTGQPEYLPPPPSAPQSIPSEPPPAYGQVTSTL